MNHQLNQQKNSPAEPESPAAIPAEFISEWASLKYDFEVAKFQEEVERVRRATENLTRQISDTDAAVP